MSIFNPSSVKSIKDETIRNYLQELNENLTYMFNNLTPDDNNAKSVPKLTVVSDDNGEAHIEVTSGGVVISAQSGVQEGELISKINSQLSVGSEGINIQTNGKLTINTTQFTLDSSGNATFAGTISGGSINIGSGNFTVNTNGTVVAKDISIQNTAQTSTGAFQTVIAGAISSRTLVVQESGQDYDAYIDVLESGEIHVNGYCYAYQFIQTSDQRLKENIADIPQLDCVELIKAIRPVSYDYKAHPNDNQVGFIAQEVIETMEQKGIDFPLTIMDKKGYYSIPYTNFIPIIVETLQYILGKVD